MTRLTVAGHHRVPDLLAHEGVPSPVCALPTDGRNWRES